MAIVSFPRPRRNEHLAARQDFELADIHFIVMRESFNPDDQETVDRFEAAFTRRCEAWDRWYFG